jgi:hypothetical protein
MRAPTTKTLIVLLVVCSFGAAVVIPTYYPAPMPVLGPDGLPVHAADGKILVHRDMANFFRMMIPGWIFMSFCAACIIWLLVRFFCFLYARWRYRNRAT